MKNKTLKYISAILMAVLFFSCQDLERPDFSDFAYDGPIITLSNPSSSGSTVVQSTEPVATITIKFQVEDDLGIANINVKVDDVEIANMTEFADNKLVSVDDLTYDVDTGSHTLTIMATDTNDVVVTETTMFEKVDAIPYTPMFNGEMFYMPFDGSYFESVGASDATVVGSPGFAGEAKVGSDAYAGATDSYLTFPTDGLLGGEFSATMWYKINATPDRGGILVIGPEDTGNANYPDVQNNRTSGFRFFRESGNGGQTFKLNVGNGTADSWFDGGAAATIDPATTEWVHLAFTISGTEAVVYINGEVAKQGDFSGVDWTGCDIISIMSGVPRFSEWGHKSDLSYMDELRLFDVALSKSEIVNVMAQGSKVFDMPFDGNYTETISQMDANEVGSPGFAGEAMVGSDAYAGTTDSYLTFPTDGLLDGEFSASMWYKINADPDRAGILVIGPEDPGNASYPDVQNNRTSGFRFFRESGNGGQTFKLNVGNGTADSWFDGGPAATIDPTTTEWVHLAFTISGTEAVVYINGEVAKQGDFSGVDWTGCDIISIMSGVPRFSEWGHKSDLSYMDNLQLYDKALSQEEIQSFMQ